MIPFYPQDWDVTKYREMGFVDQVECEYWKNSSCGVLCLKMAVEGLGGPVWPIKKYIDKGMELGAYSHERGWSHIGLAKLGNTFDFDCQNFEGVSMAELGEYVMLGSLVIVSIPTAFRKSEQLIDRIKFWRKPGGHLCLVRGVKYENDQIQGFEVNHTSINPDLNWENRLVDIDLFSQVYTGRVIVCAKK